MAEDTLSGGQVSIPVKGDAAGFAKQTAEELGAQDAEFSAIGSRVGGKILAGLAAVGLAIGVSDLFKSGADEAIGMENINAQLAAGIKSTGNAAGLSVSSMDKLAESIAGYSGQSTVSIGATEKVLQTFQNISDKGPDKVFDRATEAAANMAAKFGGDASSAALVLGKALNDPAEGLQALTRRGVTFTDAQKDQIKAMQDSGNMAGAQGLILDQLSSKFGGAAKAAGGTFSGQLDRMKVSMDAAAASAFVKLEPSLLKLMPPLTKLIEAILPVLPPLVNAASGAIQLLTPVINVLVNGAILPLLKGFQDVVDFLQGKISTAKLLAELQGLGGVIGWLVNVVDAFFLHVTQAMTGIIEWFEKAITGAEGMATSIGGYFSAIPKSIEGALAVMVNGAVGAVNAFLNGINGLHLPGVKIGLIPQWNGKIPGLADGGSLLTGGAVMVGERGPELLNLPKGASVIPLGRSSRATGTTVNNYYQQPGTSSAQFAREQGWYAKWVT